MLLVLGPFNGRVLVFEGRQRAIRLGAAQRLSEHIGNSVSNHDKCVIQYAMRGAALAALGRVARPIPEPP